MKILHYIPTYAPAWQFGGVLTAVTQLCETLVLLGHEVEVFTTNAGLNNSHNIPTNQALVRNGVKVTYFSCEINFLGIQSSAMEKAIEDRVHQFDIVHISAIWQPTSQAACRAAKSSNIPYVISPQGSFCPYSWSQKTLKKALYYLWRERWNVTNATAIHYTAQQEFEECRWLNFPSKPIIVPNGLDTDFWQPDPSGANEWRQEQGFKENEFLLLNIGRLHHKKGLDLLPPVLNKIRDLKWKMIFVGDDDDRTKDGLIKDFKCFDLLDRVYFFPKCEPKQLCTIYSASNLFILPSRHESFGNVVIESLSCGCPVVISNKVATQREVQEAGMGWSLERNVIHWTEQVRKLITDPHLLKPVIENSQEWVESNFSVKKTAKDMVLSYKELIASK